MTKSEIEKRLVAVENEIADLKAARSPTKTTHPLQTLQRIHGAFENDEAFREATRLGREWRESFRPKARKSTAKPSRSSR